MDSEAFSSGFVEDARSTLELKDFISELQSAHCTSIAFACILLSLTARRTVAGFTLTEFLSGQHAVLVNIGDLSVQTLSCLTN